MQKQFYQIVRDLIQTRFLLDHNKTKQKHESVQFKHGKIERENSF